VACYRHWPEGQIGSHKKVGAWARFAFLPLRAYPLKACSNQQLWLVDKLPPFSTKKAKAEQYSPGLGHSAIVMAPRGRQDYECLITKHLTLFLKA